MTGADYLRYAASYRDFEQQHGNRQSDEKDSQDAEVRRSARSTTWAGAEAAWLRPDDHTHEYFKRYC